MNNLHKIGAGHSCYFGAKDINNLLTDVKVHQSGN